MITKQQLELAANAAGYQLEEIRGVLKRWVDSKTGMGGGWLPWHPVTDKSDSFDLMVACGILPFWSELHCSCVVNRGKRGDLFNMVNYKDHNNDKGLATMWAVFLCAVEIGRAM
jgi:hypothetical protein